MLAAAEARGGPLPIAVEVRVAGGPGVERAGLPADRLTEALRRALSAALARHVAPEDRARARKVVGPRWRSYVLRYAPARARQEGAFYVVDVDVDVDRDRLLDALAAAGIPVHRMAAAPRVLVVSGGGPGADSAARAVSDTLRRESIPHRLYPVEDAGDWDFARLGRTARAFGCHLVFVVTGTDTEAGPGDGDEGEELPAPDRSRVRVHLGGWGLDAVRGQMLAGEALWAEGVAGDFWAALGRAAYRGGRELAARFLEAVALADWSPGPSAGRLAIRVADLPGPGAVERMERALLALSEVRSVRLAEIGFRAAEWEVWAYRGGLPWESVFPWLDLRGGTIALERTEAPPGAPPERLLCRWVPR